jgi:hypothetical protein
MRRALTGTPVEDMTGREISEFLDQCQVRISQIHAQIHGTYFDFRPRRKRKPPPKKTAAR